MRGSWVVLSALLACGFDSSGQGGDGSGSGTDSGTGGSADDGSDGGDSGDAGSGDGASADDGSSDDGSGSTGGAGTGSGSNTSGNPTTDHTTHGTNTGETTTSDACAGFTMTEIYPAADGTVEEPMGLHGDPNDPPGIWAQSEVAEQGTITWDVQLDCDAKVYLWGVVWDLRAGTQGGSDADSFYVSVDDEDPEWRWIYGCTTDQDGWSYQPVTHNESNTDCAEVRLDWDLAAGAHTVRLRNREESDFQGAAAIARLLVTTDENLVPNMQDH